VLDEDEKARTERVESTTRADMVGVDRLRGEGDLSE
jgi:hypothetical protein